MSLGKRIINTGAEAACLTDTTDIFGDSSGVALYSLDYDGSDAGGLYDGTPDSAVQFGVGGQINYGARFSSNTTGIVNTSLQLDSTAHSISLWVKPAAVVSGRWNTIFMSYFLGHPSGFLGKRSDQSTSFHYRTESGNELYFTLASADTWYHIVITRDSGGVDIYVDGSFVTSNSNSMGSYTNSIYEKTAIGSNPNYTGEYFDGDIDQVRIFSKALSSDEVSTLYAETACVYTCTTDTINYPSGTTPVAYYKFDNSAEDETGSYDGTETDIEYRFGRYGQAAVFNGSSSKITTSYTTNDSAFTISGWIKHTSTTFVGKYHYLAGKGYYSSSSNNNYWQLVNYSSEFPEFRIRSGGTSVAATSSVAMNLNQWHHLVGTVDSSGNMKIYLDGVLTGSATGAPSRTMTQGINYGVYLDGTTYFHDGQIDQIRYYSTVLDSDQVSQLYNEKPCADTSNFKTVLYTGNSSTQYISNVGFAPDLVWIKRRNGGTGYFHQLYDSVRGVQKVLFSNSPLEEYDRSNGLTSFDSNGFTLGSHTHSNETGGTYVAWSWKGGGDAVSNTDGTITSQVSANTDAGFSIVKWTGNDSASATIGHGLLSTPELRIIKKLTGTSLDWQISLDSSVTGTEGYLNFNTVSMYTTFPNYYTSANSTVLSTNGTTTLERQYNNQSANYIAYCFHSVSGISSIGTYSGTGVSGKEVALNFNPSFVLIKRTNAVAGWIIVDNQRGTKELYPHLANAEDTSTTGIVLGTNKFTLNTTGSWYNASGGTYLYMAFK